MKHKSIQQPRGILKKREQDDNLLYPDAASRYER